MTRILVAFQEGGTTPDNTAPGIWNHSNDGSVGTKVADLLDETGATTGISWAVGAGASFTELGSSGAFTSDHQGYAEECWETAWYANGDNDPIEFDGFAPNQTGTLKFGAWTSSGRNTRLNDGQGNTATAIAKAEPPNTVTTLNWQADGTGKLTISPEVVSNFVYIQFFDIEYTAVTGLAVDSTDATMQRGTSFEVVCSGATTAPTTGNTTLSNGNDTLTPSSVTGSDPYTLTFAVGDLTKQVDATGYDWTLTVDVETATTGNIPLVIQAGYTKVDLVNPVTTNASLLFGVTGDAPVTGDDLEYSVTSVLNSGVTFSVAADAVWTITEANEGDWTTAITVSRRVVQADGTIGTEAVMTFDPRVGAPAAAGSIPYAMRQMASRLSFHSYLIQESKGRWEQDQLNAAIVALGGSAMTPPVGAPDAAVGYTGTQTYLEFYKRLQRALVYPTPIDVVPAVQAALLARGWTL